MRPIKKLEFRSWKLGGVLVAICYLLAPISSSALPTNGLPILRGYLQTALDGNQRDLTNFGKIVATNFYGTGWGLSNIYKTNLAIGVQGTLDGALTNNETRVANFLERITAPYSNVKTQYTRHIENTETSVLPLSGGGIDLILGQPSGSASLVGGAFGLGLDISTLVQTNIQATATNAINATNIYNGRFFGTNWFPAGGGLAFQKFPVTTLANGANGTVAIGTNVNVELSGNTAAVSLHGLWAGVNRDGDLRLISYRQLYPFTIAHDSGVGEPHATNRIRIATGGDRVFSGPVEMVFKYSGSEGRWLLVSADGQETLAANITGGAAIATNAPSGLPVADLVVVQNTVATNTPGFTRFNMASSMMNDWELTRRVLSKGSGNAITNIDHGGLRCSTMIYDRDMIRVYYAGYTNSVPGVNAGGHIIGAFGETWDTIGKHGVVLERSASGWDSGNLGGARVYRFDNSGTNYLYYFASSNTTFETGWQSIGVAYSTNGTNWTKYQFNPLLDVGVAGAWDDRAIQGEPCVIRHNGIYYMFFGGMQTSESIYGPALDENIGIATATSPLGPWTKYSGNPVLTNAANILAEPNVFQLPDGQGWGMILGQGSAISRDLTNWTMVDAISWRDPVGFKAGFLPGILPPTTMLSPFLFDENGPAMLLDDVSGIYIARPKQAATTRSLFAGTATNIASQIPQVFPLAVPSPTGIPGVCHPSVLKTNWNGHKYWMAFASWPPAPDGITGSPWQGAFENPSIVVSEDGINWYEPRGIRNPIATNTESALYNYMPGTPTVNDSGGHLSDPELFIRADNSMVCYYRANNGIQEVTSSSSVAIGTGTKTFTVASGLGFHAGLRCRISEDGNDANFMEGLVSSYSSTTLEVTVDTIGGSGTINDWIVDCGAVYLMARTSTDGITWSAPTFCYTNIGDGALLAQQIVALPNGTKRMFYGDGVDDYRFIDATAASLLTWSPYTQTDLPLAWHSDVSVKPGTSNLWCVTGITGGENPGSYIYLYVSANNGTNWTLISTNIVSRSGARWDQYGINKPEVVWNDDGTMNIYADGAIGQTFEFTSGLTDTIFPYYASDFWKIGLYQNVTPMTNVLNSGGSNYIVAGTSEALTAVWDPNRTNWYGVFNGDFWINRLSSRNLKVVQSVHAWRFYPSADASPHCVYLTGIGNNQNGTLWIGNTNASPVTMLQIGGDMINGAGANRGLRIESWYNAPDIYFRAGHSVSDTTSGFIFDRPDTGTLNQFVTKANSNFFGGDIRWSSVAAGNGNAITNIQLASIVSRTNSYGSQSVDFATPEVTTNASGGITFASGLLNFNPTNYNYFTLHVLANGADRTITPQAHWGRSRNGFVVTNGTKATITISSQIGIFTNIAQTDWF